MLCFAVLNDGLLDVSYVMNLPAERIPEVLGSIGQPSDQHSAQIQDCWGSLRVPSLEVSCKEGLQVTGATPCFAVKGASLSSLVVKPLPESACSKKCSICSCTKHAWRA